LDVARTVADALTDAILATVDWRRVVAVARRPLHAAAARPRARAQRPVLFRRRKTRVTYKKSSPNNRREYRLIEYSYHLAHLSSII